MAIPRVLLRPVAFLAGAHASRQLNDFMSSHQQTAQRQDRLLMELVRRHQESSFGQDHHFDRIRGYDDFKAAVPVGNYETHRPYIQQVLEGRTSALLPPGETVLMFSMTSGTTGQPKHIPVTRRFLANMRRGWNIFGLKVLQDHPDGWLRPILQISSSTREATSPTGLSCGAISGLLAQTQKTIVRRMYVVPQEVMDLSEPAVKYYLILRCSIGRKIGLITTANPSSTIKLIETAQAHVQTLIRDVADGTVSPPGPTPPSFGRHLKFRKNPALAARLEEGLRRDGQLLPRHFWNPAVLCNWTGGTVHLYLRRLRELFPGVAIRDIGLLASEGRFSIPLADEAPAGVAEITSNFLEFIPSQHAEGDNPPTLRAHELEVGQDYSLVLSNWAGLWRYNIDDRVRVVSRLGQSPVFEFLSRGRHTANITGEKITEHQVVEAMRRATGRGGAAVELFELQGHFAKLPYYELRLEEAPGVDPKRLAEAMDHELGELNIEYASKRKTGRLGAIRPKGLPSGTLANAEAEKIRQRRGRGEQYKHQYLLIDVVEGP